MGLDGKMRSVHVLETSGWPCNIRKIGVGDYGRLRGAAGDCWVKPFAQLNKFMFQAEVLVRILEYV